MRGASSNVSRADFVAPNLASNTHKKGGGGVGWEGWGGGAGGLFVGAAAAASIHYLPPAAPAAFSHAGSSSDESA